MLGRLLFEAGLVPLQEQLVPNRATYLAGGLAVDSAIPVLPQRDVGEVIIHG